ncbi:DUF3089 domain-containing protein [Winogradskyella psychrotolerans]|uniref:DUF3089 domain-containing protein n=1 Tax=Winogradskyella psychrotolerans TaxID=1344585 RepID=UPI001C071005|nr:DUF3089 domain-containing protein [Winogradskyella psychrotolerans]MBU2928217.1 DUF3089 domain-containing protein [Winogradskyella psychrotolerans]
MKYTWSLLFLLFFSCSSTQQEQESEPSFIEIPISTIDYSTMSNWYFHPNQSFNFLQTYDLDIAVIDEDLSISSTIEINNNATTNTGIDVFWVHPTVLENPPTSPSTVSIDNQDTNYIGQTILAQGALLAKYGRFFAPKYRQASPASFLSIFHTEEERATALLETYSDIKASFQNYLDNHNNGNKIILAGHSQGSFLLAMLVRDLFDTNPELREKLVTAALGGMGYVYATDNSTLGGWWKNIGLCTTTNECGCVHYWRSYENDTNIPEPVSTLPSYSETLVTSGLVYRTTDINNDIFFQDNLIFETQSSPLRYITPGIQYNFSNSYNFVAFDNMYTARFKRESNQKTGLAVDYIANTLDQRLNELENVVSPTTFINGDYHIKDYHIYIWALMQQIDEKISDCL